MYRRLRLVESFFFSSRRRHTRFDCDWSSDVCSSDLINTTMRSGTNDLHGSVFDFFQNRVMNARSEERRVGKSVDLGGRRIIKKKKQIFSARVLVCSCYDRSWVETEVRRTTDQLLNLR